MSITRKSFCAAMASSPALLWLQGCGGGSDYSDAPAPPPPAVGGACASRAISENHGHVLAFNRADLDSTTNRSYSIRGSGDHDHIVTLTVAQLQSLKAGNTFDVVSSSGGGHVHDVTVSCA